MMSVNGRISFKLRLCNSLFMFGWSSHVSSHYKIASSSSSGTNKKSEILPARTQTLKFIKKFLQDFCPVERLSH